MSNSVFFFFSAKEALDNSQKNLDNDVKFLKSDVFLCILLSGCFLAKITPHGEGAIFVAI